MILIVLKFIVFEQIKVSYQTGSLIITLNLQALDHIV